MMVHESHAQVRRHERVHQFLFDEFLVGIVHVAVGIGTVCERREVGMHGSHFVDMGRFGF